ncbi:MAG: O-antigen ligase family protein [Alphaproteobacteria bacterium]
MTAFVTSSPVRHAGDLAGEGGWAARLRLACNYLFAMLPMMLLVTRVGAEIIVAAIGLSFLAVIAARRRWDVLAQPLVAVPIAIWIYLMAVNTPLAWLDPSAVLGRTVPWLRFFCLFGAVVFWLFADERDFRRVVVAWGVTLAFVVIDGFVQGIFGTSLSGHTLFMVERLTGPLDRPNIGRFVALLFYPGLAAYLVVGERRLEWKRILAIIISTAAAVAFTVFTAERAATVLNLATFTTAMVIYILVVPRFRLGGSLGILVVLMIAAATVILSARVQMRIEPTLAVLRDFRDSPYGELVRAAVTVWQGQPVTGVGLGNFDMVCKARELELVYGCLRHPHNIYLEWLAEGGAIGLAGFLAFFGAVLALVLGLLRAREGRPALTALLLACPVLTFMPFVPSQSFFSNWPAILWWTSLAMTCAVAFHARYRMPQEGSPA